MERFTKQLSAYLRVIGPRRIFGSFAGNFVIAIGVSIFKFTQLGNDPSAAVVMAAAGRVGVSFTQSLLVFNIAWFLVPLLWGRKYIGIGTFVNWFLIGPVADAFTALYARTLTMPESLAARVAVMLFGVVFLCFGISLYQTSDSGISPYDALSIVASERLRLPYIACRVFFDAFFSLAAWLLGGIVGLGTLVCAVGLGPLITFFNRHVSERLMRVPHI